MYSKTSFLIISLIFTLALALACGGSGGSSDTASDPNLVVISGTVDDNAGLSKPSQKIATSALQLAALNLTTLEYLPSANLNYTASNGTYTVSSSKGTPLAIQLSAGGNILMSRVLSSTETESRSSKNITLVTHLQSVRALNHTSGGNSLSTALVTTNQELFATASPQETDLILTMLPESMQVALLTFQEAATDITTNAAEITLFNSVLVTAASDFNVYYRSLLSGSFLALQSAAQVSNSSLIPSNIWTEVALGAANEIPGVISKTANYTLLFQSDWSSSTHDEVPSNAHFSKLIGLNHSSEVSLYALSAVASMGIKNMAETGSTIPLDTEITTLIGGNTNSQMFVATGSFTSPGNTSLSIAVNSDNALISAVSMIAPSPDWFIGVSGVDLFDGGTWVSSKTVDLYPYDAGTDSGETFTSSDNATNPQGTIQAISGSPFLSSGNLTKLGTITFTKQ